MILLVSILTTMFASVLTNAAGADLGSAPFIDLFDGNLKFDQSQFYDGTVIHKLPDTVKDTDEISLIIRLDNESLLDVHTEKYSTQEFSEFYLTDEAAAIRKQIADDSESLRKKLMAKDIDFTTGESYATLFGGFEITIKAADFLDVCKTVGNDANVIVGDVYEVEETKLVENKVNAFETGIFDTTGFDYDGTGMVVAVLDTGTDYYHSAFSMDNFTAPENKWGLTFDDVKNKLAEKDFAAEGFNPGLTASDVYISGKLPYGYDYADKDSDVFPINSHHGTHVAGIIAGKDDTITGVAPNAQIVTMKIFSDIQLSARTSWILAALEDTFLLGVDVINMSIGTACGYSRETDKEQISGVYDKIRDAGISMVVAASNSFNSAYSSEKNGNLPLTTNPDSATVGSPSTYKGAMSVASIEGVKTSYILFGDTIIYFEESTDRVAEEKNFVKELLGDKKELEIEYVLIPGSGIAADYSGIDIEGKVALIKRGSNTFEEKANTAEKMGAAACIIYNNVSGDIKMNVGETTIAVCSISQNDGELLAKSGTGKIKISSAQAAGPFMSDFSSWGPTPDLGIKPEITAHGGSILSAVPGQDYDRLSGTSMATPNISGVTALLRQYVMENFPESVTKNPTEVTAVINRLMMSTADIIYGKNGNPYAIRKQGAGLANLVNCANTTAYILTYDRYDNSVMDKSKIELGDDPTKSGVYKLVFTIDNFGKTALTYNVDALVMTEGVSETKTNQGDTTVTETAVMLDAGVSITSVNGGTQNGSKVTVNAGSKATVTVTITLTDGDKKYLDESFKNGMYVEGFVTLDAEGDTVDLNVPYLAFYGDWTVAPLFDLDYYATNKDELDDGIDLFDKTLADAFATRPIGGTYDDYVSYLGSYYYEQKPGSNKIAADRKYISLTNQEMGVNELKYVWAGMLRNADRVEVTIVDDATGEIVFETVDNDIRKSYGDGGPIRPSNIDIGFSAIDENLKNNSKYTVTLKGYLDYGDGGADTNLNNTFTFPLTIDFEAPTITDCQFYTEYDKSAKKTRLFTKIAIYDNHYAMAMLPGYISYNPTDPDPYIINTFDRYLTPIYSEENSTTYVTYELTDYIDDIKEGAYTGNTFTITAYDYALNISTYEIALPGQYLDLYFEETDIELYPNQLYDLAPMVYPNTQWSEFITYTSTNPKVATVVNNKILAISNNNNNGEDGQCVIVATVILEDGTKLQRHINVTVKPADNKHKYDPPVLDTFNLTGYYINKAYFFLANEDRDLGETGKIMKFVGDSYSLKMFPSESVTIQYDLNAYFPDATKVVFESGNPNIAEVSEDGTIVAVAEGFTSITARVLLNGKSTYYSKSISIQVKDPYVTSGPSLSHYFGNGGYVHIDEDLGITEIGQYAFSNFDYIPKGEGDEISEEEPELTKIWFLGDDTITKVKIPEGVETIGPFAFANLSKLTEVILPSTLKTIDYGAFYNCHQLTTVKGIENVKFINRSAFQGCGLSGTLDLKSAVAIGDFAFAENSEYNSVGKLEFFRNRFTTLILSENCKSVASYAFSGNKELTTLTVNSEFLKLGQYAFNDCEKLESASINAAVIPAGAFNDCIALKSVTIGKDVSVISEYAFRNTQVSSFTVANGNTVYCAQDNKPYLISRDGSELLLAAPTLENLVIPADSGITVIGIGAFSGNEKLVSVNMPSVTEINNYAFAECTSLKTVSFGTLTKIGDYAFLNTALETVPANTASKIGKYAFASTNLTSVVIADGVTVGEGAFESCDELASVTVGNDVTLGKYAFRSNVSYMNYHVESTGGTSPLYYYVFESALHSLKIGKNADIGEGAFWFAAELEEVTLGEGAKIGDYAFYTNASLTAVHGLEKALSIGKSAFSGDIRNFFTSNQPSESNVALDDDGYYILKYYSAQLPSLDLSACEYIGEEAFAYCQELVSVTLGDNITVIPTGAFRSCEKLNTVNLDGITSIGDYAFTQAALTSVDIKNVTEIGEYAFCEAPELVSVTLSPNIVSIREGAFSYSPKLAIVNGMEHIEHVGDYAFAYTAITSADLTGAKYLGTHAFLKENLTPFTVTLGESLEDIGDNPFAWCDIVRFSKEVVESFNGKDYPSTIYDFDLGDNVKVIGGSLYRVIPLGLELITWCDDPQNVTATVAEGTTRISAYAFAGSDAINVILPYTVESIGHKAFFGCDKLSIVNFSSYYAPILEEEYDIYYFYTPGNLPQEIGLVNYVMWNASSDPSNVFYGANFMDYVGKVTDKAVMVKPSNGIGYDSFIFAQYFDVILEGASAADDATLAAISAINALPDKVALSDKKLVEAARALYNKIATNEQLGLVYNSQKLFDAEKRIASLEYLENEKNEEPVTEPAEQFPVWAIVLIVVGGVIVLGGLGVGGYFLYRYLMKKKAEGEDPDGTEPDATEPDTLPEVTDAVSDTEAEGTPTEDNAMAAEPAVAPEEDYAETEDTPAEFDEDNAIVESVTETDDPEEALKTNFPGVSEDNN